jgi:hypothetical protein
VAVVTQDRDHLKELAGKVHANVTLAEAMIVSYYTPNEFRSELVRLAAGKKSASPAAAKKRQKDLPPDRRENPSRTPAERTDGENLP